MLKDINDIKEFYEQILSNKYCNYLDILNQNESLLNENKNIISVLNNVSSSLSEYSKNKNFLNNIPSYIKSLADFANDIDLMNKNYVNFKQKFDDTRVINPSPSKNIFWIEEQLEKTQKQIEELNLDVKKQLNPNLIIEEYSNQSRNENESESESEKLSLQVGSFSSRNSKYISNGFNSKTNQKHLENKKTHSSILDKLANNKTVKIDKERTKSVVNKFNDNFENTNSVSYNLKNQEMNNNYANNNFDDKNYTDLIQEMILNKEKKLYKIFDKKNTNIKKNHNFEKYLNDNECQNIKKINSGLLNCDEFTTPVNVINSNILSSSKKSFQDSNLGSSMKDKFIKGNHLRMKEYSRMSVPKVNKNKDGINDNDKNFVNSIRGALFFK